MGPPPFAYSVDYDAKEVRLEWYNKERIDSDLVSLRKAPYAYTARCLNRQSIDDTYNARLGPETIGKLLAPLTGSMRPLHTRPSSGLHLAAASPRRTIESA